MPLRVLVADAFDAASESLSSALTGGRWTSSSSALIGRERTVERAGRISCHYVQGRTIASTTALSRPPSHNSREVLLRIVIGIGQPWVIKQPLCCRPQPRGRAQERARKRLAAQADAAPGIRRKLVVLLQLGFGILPVKGKAAREEDVQRDACRIEGRGWS